MTGLGAALLSCLTLAVGGASRLAAAERPGATSPESAAPAPSPAGDERSADELRQGIEDAHPATYYLLASKLFASGERDEAVFWFYAGQLRFRFHLAAHPDLEPSGDPALFASLSEVVGRPLNEYAFGDLEALKETLERVLAWDEKTKNGFTSKKDYAEAWDGIRTGLAQMVAYVSEHGAEIRAQRTAHGLENRG